MTTYYDYLKDRVVAASAGNQAHLEHLIHSERNALWQQIVANPAYDEQGRLQALAAFDEAASRILFEQSARLEQAQRAPAAAAPAKPRGIGRLRAARDDEPREEASQDAGRTRPILRDLLFLLLGAVLGFAAGYLAKGSLAPLLTSSTAVDNDLGVLGLTAPDGSFRFVRSNPSPLEGKLTVEYAPSAPSESYGCEVEATYRQVLEYVRFDDACRKVAFKFLPLPELWRSFNYVEGYMVFSATITSPAGSRWEGSASVYFSINGETS